MTDEPRQQPTPAGLIAETVASALAGGLVGAFSAFQALLRVHGLWAGVGLAAVLAGGLTAGLGHRRPGAGAPAAAAAGWLVVAGYFSGGRPEGDVIVPGTTQGYSFLVAGAAGLAFGIWYGLRRGRRFTSGAQQPNNSV